MSEPAPTLSAYDARLRFFFPQSLLSLAFARGLNAADPADDVVRAEIAEVSQALTNLYEIGRVT